MIITAQQRGLFKPTFKHIEAELYKYNQTVKEIQRLRYTIIESSGIDENIGGGKSNLPSSPTEIKATRLTTHKQLEYLEDIAYAIETVYNLASDNHKKLIRVRYWSGRNLTWDEIAEELHCNPKTAQRWRDQVVLSVAEMLGWR